MSVARLSAFTTGGQMSGLPFCPLNPTVESRLPPRILLAVRNNTRATKTAMAVRNTKEAALRMALTVAGRPPGLAAGWLRPRRVEVP